MVAQIDGKGGVLDNVGHAAIPLLYDRVGTFSEGLAAIKRDGAYGYADKTGQVVIPCAYSAAGGFHEGYAAVRKDGGWGIWQIETRGG